LPASSARAKNRDDTDTRGDRGLLPGSLPAARSPNADVHLTHFVTHLTPGQSDFTIDVTVENRGLKKATAVQAIIHPYVGTRDTLAKANGPDEMPLQVGGDPMRNVTENVAFPDLDPGKSATQTMQFPMRSDADPRQRDDDAKVTFQTVNP
jgi:hypothetical protein